MSSNKHKVATDALETLGKIIDENAGRDAIHLAVEPCIAGERLNPGLHVGIVDGKAVLNPKKYVGIVDPFLTNPIQAGERFWLIVYPRTITSLRHVWSHPDFEPAKELPTAPIPTDPVEISKAWIANFADQIRQHPEALMDAADTWVHYQDYTYDNSERYKDHWDKFPEFWTHYEVVRGVKVSSKESFFTCSC